MIDEDTEKLKRWKYLTEELLPHKARQQRWPLRLDHCFKRVCLDHAFQDVWYKHLPRPAQQHLYGKDLQRALDCAETILSEGAPALTRYNEQSLRYRGKLRT